MRGAFIDGYSPARKFQYVENLLYKEVSKGLSKKRSRGQVEESLSSDFLSIQYFVQHIKISGLYTVILQSLETLNCSIRTTSCQRA